MPTFTLTSGNDDFSFTSPANDVADLVDETIYGLGGDDSITGSQGDDFIYGGDGDDTINSSFGLNFPDSPTLGNGTPLFSDGGDTVYGGAGDDVITSVGPDPDGPGPQMETPSSIRDTVYGGLGNDSIVGNVDQSDPDAVLDTLYGGLGNDTIDGNTGDDLIFGEGGDDLILARSGVDTTDGGDGIDTIDFRGEAPGANVVFNIETGATTITGVATDTESNTNYENAIGTTQDDTITGSSVANSIGGDDGNDFLTGGENAAIGAISDDGSDTFSSGGGNDSIIGGEDTGDTDIDVLDYSNEVAGVIVTYTGDESGTATGVSTDTDTFAQIENIVFTSQEDSVRAEADTGGVTLDTAAGNDFVESGSGSDSLDGGDDIDRLSYQQSADPVDLDLEAGTGTGGNADGDTFVNFETYTLTDGNDNVEGSARDETVDGSLGDDTIEGGAGADSLQGGDGIDTVDYTNSAAPVEVDLAAQTVDGGDGTGDTIDGFENVTGSAGDDTLTGDGNDNVIDGGDGNDTLDGGDGNDTIIGGAGNDTIDNGPGDDSVDAGTGNDVVDGGEGNDTLDGGDGIDTYDASDAPGPVTIDLANDTATGTGIGDDVVLNFEGATGTDGNDTITGGPEDNTLDGGGGDDTLDGGDGNDSIDGGDGNDSIDGGDGNDDIDAGPGDDTVDGGDGDDTIDGGDGNDSIDGGPGDDTIDGGNDNDTIDGGDGNDSIDGGDGNDTLDGGDGNDTLVGGDGTDTLDGGPGNDTLDGGLGDDDFTVSTGDTALGGGGDDEFFVPTSGLTGPGTISITGGETDEEDVIDPTNNPGGRIGDVLTVGVQPGENLEIVYSGGNDEAGQIFVTDAAGDTITTIDFAEIEEIVCFTRGTMIETPNGEVAIEDLSEGDLVMTRDNGAQPLRWIGSQAVSASGKRAPVMIKAGALGNDRDLRVSQLHRMLIADWRAELMFGEVEVLAAAKHLVNGDTIFVEEGGEVEYFHMLFDNHEIVTANGAASESFHPGEQGMGWMAEETREEILDLFPQLRVDLQGFGPAARTSLKAYEARALKK